jgi:ariadne-1
MDNPTALNVAAGLELAPPPPPSSSSSRSKSPAKRATRRSAAESAKSKASSSAAPPANEPFVCAICFDDTQSESSALDCGHKFCTSCWSLYLTSKIREEGECVIRCMATDCTLVAQDSFIKTLLKDDPPTFARFQELVVRHFVSSNPNLKYCPYPSCTHTVSCPAAASKSALATIVPTMHCGASSEHVFCFGCPIDADHRPVVCSVAKLWLKKCQDDSETANWIKSNTKECSKCQSTIEKNGGCK